MEMQYNKERIGLPHARVSEFEPIREELVSMCVYVCVCMCVCECIRVCICVCVRAWEGRGVEIEILVSTSGGW